MEIAMTADTQAGLALAGLLDGSGAAPEASAACCPVCGRQPPRQHRALPRLHGELLVAWLAANCQRPSIRVSQIAAAVGSASAASGVSASAVSGGHRSSC